MERSYNRYRQDEDQDIEGGVPGGVAVPEGRGVDAMALDVAVPVALDGVALEDGGEGEGEEGCDDGGVDDPADLLEAGDDEDVKVEEYEGHFGQSNEDLVGDLVEVEVLQLLEGREMNEWWELLP
jgi:hypothetical protein